MKATYWLKITSIYIMIIAMINSGLTSPTSYDYNGVRVAYTYG